MAIMPLEDERLIAAYRCGACGKTFLRGDENVSCTVMHGPGSCCHYTDREVSIAAILEVRKILEGI